MNRVFVYLVALTLISLLLGMVGVQTTGVLILNKLGVDNNYNISEAESGGFWQDILSIVGVAGIFVGAATLFIGLYTRSISKIPAGLIFAGTLAAFIGDFIGIFNALASFGTVYKYVSVLIFAPLLIGYLYSILDWFMTST